MTLHTHDVASPRGPSVRVTFCPDPTPLQSETDPPKDVLVIEWYSSDQPDARLPFVEQVCCGCPVGGAGNTVVITFTISRDLIGS